jgi:hypothetical protein
MGKRNTNRLERGGPSNLFPYCLYDEIAQILAALRRLEPQGAFYFRWKVNVQRHGILNEHDTVANCAYYSLTSTRKPALCVGGAGRTFSSVAGS